MTPTASRRTASEDAFGHALLDHLEGRGGAELIERRDGYIDVASRDLGTYFRPFGECPPHEQRAAELVRGRTLDVGCGAGRWLLHLQERGMDVVGIDVSPLALEVCRMRGARDVRALSIAEVGEGLGRFDTVLMMGNNFGLFGSLSGARRLLRRFHRITPAHGRIVGEVLDPYRTEEPFHLRYHAENRRRGRLSGQLRIRVRYKGYRTPWFDYLFVSAQEMREIVRGTGWRVAHVIESGGGAWVGVLEKA